MSQVYPSAPPRPAVTEFAIPDRAAFLRTLDLASPALQSVRAALERGDVDAAGRAFIAHFRRRPIESPQLTDWTNRSPDPARTHSVADDCLRGRLWDGYNIYEIPASGIDWHECPLFCLPRFPVFPDLAAAFHDTGDARYLRFIVDHSLEYIRAYPIESLAGRSSLEGYRNHYLVGPPTWWCLHPNRLDEWCDVLTLVRTSPLVSDEEILTILHRMAEEIRYQLTQTPYWVGQAHNVACFIIRVMGRLCSVMADFVDAPQWRRLNAEWLGHYIDQAFYPDGHFKELTTAYGVSCVQQISQIAYELRDEPGVVRRRDHLRMILSAAMALAGPSGRVPSFGDCIAMRVDAALFAPMVQWLDLPWMAAVSRHAAAPTGLPQPLPPFVNWPRPGSDVWGGYYTMRSDWSAQARYMVIDGGPWGTTHQHMDRLSFVLSAFGADFLADPCCTLYANNEPDARLSTLHAGFAHSTIAVDGVDEFVRTQDEWATAAPLRNKWIETPHWSMFVGSFDFAPLKAVHWERRILFVDGRYWVLQDVLTGELPSAAIEQNFQFEAEIELDVRAERSIATADNGARLVVLPLEGGLIPRRIVGQEGPHATCSTQYGVYTKPGELSHGRGWIARWTNRILPAPALVFDGTVRLPHVLTLALVPLPAGAGDGAMPAITSRREGNATLWRLPAAHGPIELRTSVEEFRVTGSQ